MKIQINDDTGKIVLHPVTEPRAKAGHTVKEVDSIPEIPVDKILSWDSDFDRLVLIDVPPPPLRQRLKALTASFPAPVRAAFSQGFIAVNYWLDEGDEEAAQAVIDSFDVSGQPQEIQDAKAALLAEFG